MERCFCSPPSAREARGGEGRGGGCFGIFGRGEFAETPPTPDPSPPLRGGRGEERTGDDAAEGFTEGGCIAVDNSTSVGKNPASVLPAPVGAISSAERSSRAFAISANWCSRGDHPRAANHWRKRSGSSAAGSVGNAGKMLGGTLQDLSRNSRRVEGGSGSKSNRHRRSMASYSVTGRSEISQSLPLKIEM